ncbi:hypothetical protein PsYK624_107270 [Phanerochaete sordida]|uniref:CST complex subunit STN1 n=1 Tax=Phanerochaete sordida TaxID=48140 RepID=A0A9P3LHW1_9APHY|nr:hypothetical protein PsYK624_107270 [Phanerochaete sordida]
MNAAKLRPRSPAPREEQPPPKRTRLSSPALQGSAAEGDARRTPHTHSQLWKWTLTADAVAPCRIQDILALQECEGAKAGVDPDFFWLGRVPCRSVLTCGVIVGVQQYELRTAYFLDDGTGMIECSLRHNLVQPPSSPRKPSSSAMAKYQPPKRPAASGSQRPLEPPKPLAAVGDIVRVVGRVLNRWSSRIINAEKIVVCKDPTEEPLHWLAVADLHKAWYHPPNPEPFTIPQPKTQPTKANAATSQPAPSLSVSQSKASNASSAPSTPSTSATSVGVPR